MSKKYDSSNSNAFEDDEEYMTYSTRSSHSSRSQASTSSRSRSGFSFRSCKTESAPSEESMPSGHSRHSRHSRHSAASTVSESTVVSAATRPSKRSQYYSQASGREPEKLQYYSQSSQASSRSSHSSRSNSEAYLPEKAKPQFIHSMSMTRSLSSSPSRSRSRSPPLSNTKSVHRSIYQSPTRSISQSPDRSRYQSPARSISQSPDRRISQSPDRSMYQSPARSNSHSPARSISQSPGRSISQSPDRSISQSPDRSISQSPARSVSQSPDRSMYQSPARSVSHSPARSVSQSPDRSISQSPARSVSQSPDRSISQSPDRSMYQSPTRSVSQSPDRSMYQSPTRSVSQSPERSISQSPDRSMYQSPARSVSHTPARSISQSPDRSVSQSPDRSFSQSPDRSVSYTPDRGLSQSSQINISQSPDRRLSQSSQKSISQSQSTARRRISQPPSRQRISQSSAGRRISQSPPRSISQYSDRSNSQSPARSFCQSPTRSISNSPHKQKNTQRHERREYCYDDMSTDGDEPDSDPSMTTIGSEAGGIQHSFVIDSDDDGNFEFNKRMPYENTKHLRKDVTRVMSPKKYIKQHLEDKVNRIKSFAKMRPCVLDINDSSEDESQPLKPRVPLNKAANNAPVVRAKNHRHVMDKQDLKFYKELEVIPEVRESNEECDGRKSRHVTKAISRGCSKSPRSQRKPSLHMHSKGKHSRESNSRVIESYIENKIKVSSLHNVKECLDQGFQKYKVLDSRFDQIHEATKRRQPPDTMYFVTNNNTDVHPDDISEVTALLGATANSPRTSIVEFEKEYGELKVSARSEEKVDRSKSKSLSKREVIKALGSKPPLAARKASQRAINKSTHLNFDNSDYESDNELRNAHILCNKFGFSNTTVRAMHQLNIRVVDYGNGYSLERTKRRAILPPIGKKQNLSYSTSQLWEMSQIVPAHKSIVKGRSSECRAQSVLPPSLQPISKGMLHRKNQLRQIALENMYLSERIRAAKAITNTRHCPH